METTKPSKNASSVLFFISQSQHETVTLRMRLRAVSVDIYVGIFKTAVWLPLLHVLLQITHEFNA